MTTLVPNLHFCGQCEAAITAYQKAFRAEVSVLLRYEDADPRDWDVRLTEEEKRYIYHAELTVGGQRMMFSDDMAVDMTPGKNAFITVIFDSADEVKRAYEALREGCTIIYPMRSTTYSALMVSLVDRFGVRWGLMTEATE